MEDDLVCMLSHVWLFEKPLDSSPPAISFHGIFQTRILEWVANSYSRGSPQPGIEPVSLASPTLVGGFFTTNATSYLSFNIENCVDHNKLKFFKWWEYQTTLSASWEICMQVKKQQLELDMEQWTGSKLGKEYVKTVYCPPAYLTYMQSVSEKAMETHSSTLAWKIPWMEEPGRLQSMGSWRVEHNWVNSLSLFTFMHWRRKWKPTPVFLPGESQGQGSLVGCCLLGCT